MTRTEYEEKIYEIIERLKKCNSDSDRVALDELKKYKPFRLGWQVADTMYRWNIDSANTWPTILLLLQLLWKDLRNPSLQIPPGYGCDKSGFEADQMVSEVSYRRIKVYPKWGVPNI